MHKTRFGLALATGLAVLASIASAATQVVAPPPGLVGWSIVNFDGGTFTDMVPPDATTPGGTQSSFVAGPAGPPAGLGSLHQVVGANGDDATRIGSPAGLGGTLLTTLTDVSYSTYVTANNVGQATYLVLRIDLDGDGTTDDRLFFEPAYQNGGYGMLYGQPAVPNQCGVNPNCVSLGVWQAWDADVGGWWSENDSAGGPPLTTLAAYAAQYPGAKIAVHPGAIRVQAGGGAGAWDNFDGNADALTIGGTTYDFEPCSLGPLFVDDTGSDAANDCQTMATPCQTVQKAVDIACPNATVNVAAGTYPEIVTIPKSLHVVGAGKAATTIQAPGSFPAAGVIVTVTGISTSAEIRDLTVAGPGASGCGSIRAGIFVRDGATADIHDNAVRSIRDNPLSGCQNGLGILVGSVSLATTGSATIQDNDVTDYQKGGIVVANTGSSATIDGNTVTGVGVTTLIAQNGIQVSDGATGQVTGNDVSNNLCDHGTCGLNGYQSIGILLADHIPPFTVSGNTVTVNDLGIYNFTTSAGTTAISNNDVTISRFEGVFLDQGTASLTGNTVSNAVYYGVQVYAFASVATGDSVATLSCNTISDNGTGIQLQDDDPMDAFVPTVSGSNNQISGNTTGADNTTTILQNLESNYWGNGTGPNPPGSGDTLSGPIDADPFLTLVPACIACTTNADCANGLACDGSETCSAGSCQPGTAIVCTPTQCQATSTCSEPSGTCATTPKPNGILCSDGQACTIGDTCQGGICSPGPGGDADNDGDCDADEAACGCNGMDGSEVCILPNRLVGLPGSGVGEVLLNWHTPTVRKVPIATDPSCQDGGVCTAGRCTAGQINDVCTVNADCDLAPDTCRVIVNYADTADLTLDFARVNRTDVTSLFSPPAPGCSRKVDIPIDSARHSNRLKLKATGTIDTHTRRDRDTILSRSTSRGGGLDDGPAPPGPHPRSL